MTRWAPGARIERKPATRAGPRALVGAWRSPGARSDRRNRRQQPSRCDGWMGTDLRKVQTLRNLAGLLDVSAQAAKA
jgi:hypothetical protein